MITARLSGGIGNQMFQYAAGRSKALKSSTELQLDVSYFDFKLPGITKRAYSLDVFAISATLKQSSFLNFLFHRIFKGRENFQSANYFAGYEEIIRKDFTLREPLTGASAELFHEIRNCASIAVHVRRGDYVGNTFHSMLDDEYYKRGLECISEKSTIEKIYVFSDDIEWCKINLHFNIPTIFVGDEYAGKHGEGHLMLMSACKNFVIANSTFSWWGAWLGDNPSKIIVAPKKWFADNSIDTQKLIPENWVRI